MKLSDDIKTLKGVGSAVAQKLTTLGVYTVDDLINYYPRKYQDYSKVSTIKEIKPGNTVTIEGKISTVNGRYVRRGMHITEALVSDKTGSMRLVWFNQPYRANAIKPDQPYYISGNFELSRGRLAITNPAIELVSSFTVNTARIIPVYRETKGLKSATIRKVMGGLSNFIADLPEILPPSVITSNSLLSRSQALVAIHFPESEKHLEAARTRLGFEELFAITLASLLNKQQFMTDSGVKIYFDEKLAKKFVGSLDYTLTNAQRRVVWQIYKDMEANIPMNRLVEGDVGSGKTLVAAMSAVMTLKAGYNVAFMAPTELLASQHTQTLRSLLSSTEYKDTVDLLVGSMKSAEKQKLRTRVKNGEIRFIVGTHALISDAVDMHKLGLVIIDEQHRFGVEQRKKLQAKAGHMPHVLSMTATPIPRTLALTVYGELDVSVLDELPSGRVPVITKLVSPNSRQQLYEAVEAQLAEGRQMFVVCPLIEDSDRLNILSAESVYSDLSKKVFKHRRVGLLHGKMKPAEKDSIMARFVNGDLDILVSTTVVEVGVDVPNSSVMLIEGVERFGLAQLHQLRGRVGRGLHQGYCYLVMSDSKEPSRRLRAIESTTDGFSLAELDLNIRGPGAIYGVVQSGQLDLRVANLSDTRLVSAARESAKQFLDGKEDLEQFKTLNSRVQKFRSVTSLN